MPKPNWKKKRLQDKVEQNRNTSSDADALDRLVNLETGIYAYKILNNNNRPLIGNDGVSNVILYDRTLIKNIAFTISETKTKVQEVTRGEISEGKNIIKYKTATLLNVDKSLEEYDVFSKEAISPGIYDKSNLNIFVYEEESGSYEREEISNHISKTGQSVSLITINALDIYREQSIYFETYTSRNQIPQLKPGYKVTSLKYNLPTGVGVIYNAARAVSNGIEEDVDILLDEANTDAKIFLSKFSMADNYTNVLREEYSNPMNQLKFNEAVKYYSLKNIIDVIGKDTEDKKSILNLIIGLLTINYFQNRRYQDLTRDAQGNITDTIRGFSMADADKFENSEINDNFIKYWIENITEEKNKIIAYGYIAMLSDYIESSYTFKTQQNMYAQLYRFKAIFVYDAKLKTINNFETPVELLLIQNIYDINVQTTPAVNPNNPDVVEHKIIGLKSKFKNLSKPKLSSNILGITFAEPTDTLQANNISNFIGENKPSEDGKYFALQATKNYDELLTKYQPSETIIKPKGTKEVRKIIKSYSSNEVYELFKRLDLLKYRMTIGGILQGIISIISPGASMAQFNEIFKNLAAEFQNWTVWILNKFKENNVIKIPTSNDYEISKTISSSAYIIDINTGKKYNQADEEEVKKLGLLLEQTYQAYAGASSNGQNPGDRIIFYEEVEYEITYLNDVTAENYNGLISEQEYYDNQQLLNLNDRFTFATKFSPKHKDSINSIVSVDLITKGGGEIVYIKNHEWLEDGNLVQEEKRYHYNLSASHSFKQALFKIYDN